MPQRKNNPSAPFVAKPEPQNRSKIVVETPGVEDETERKGEFSDRIKHEPYSNLGPGMRPNQPIERT